MGDAGNDDDRWGDWSATALRWPGTCAGIMAHDWARRVERRYGAAAVAAIEAALARHNISLARAPAADARLPMGLPLVITALTVRHGAGSWDALAPAWRQDAIAPLPRWLRPGLRAAGLDRLIRYAPQVHAHLYDQGTCQLMTVDASIILEFSDHPLFLDPHWQRIASWTVEAVASLCGARLDYTWTIGAERATMCCRVDS